MQMSDLFHSDIMLKFLAALLALPNPLYGIPIFLGMTQGYTTDERNRTALIASAAVTATAVVALLAGEEILGIFGVDIASFRVAGGIIILGIGLAMLRAEKPAAGDAKAAEEARAKPRGIAVVPLAIPLTIGPGAIATAIVFAHQLDDAAEIVTLLPPLLFVCALVALGLRFAEPIAHVLGNSVINVITRIMAIILAAVAVEMIISGVFDAVDQHYPHLLGS